MEPRKVTIGTIAEKAKVSPNTVSRALNDKEGVSEEKRELIKRIASELNYRPNILAKSMRQKHTGFIGVLVLDIGNRVFTRMIKGIEEQAMKESFTIIIGNSDESESKELRHLETMLSTQCSGIIISQVTDSSLEMLKREGIPFVVMDRDTGDRDFDRVYVDEQRMGYIATAHLLELGHRDIAFIGRVADFGEVKRAEGYKAALRDFGVKLNPDRFYLCRTASEGSRAFQRLWQDEERATGLVIAHHIIGEGVVSMINSMMVQIPRELSVVVIGEPVWATLFSTNYTTVERPLEEIGRKAASLLIKRIKDHLISPPHNEVVPASLIVRNSSASVERTGDFTVR